jgi:DNA-binding CsgD family transcriptional regulator
MGGTAVSEDGRAEWPAEWLGRLSPVERALLDRLASGATIAAAATAEFLSLRTANRRIADLRRKAGVGTTRELVGLYRSSR